MQHLIPPRLGKGLRRGLSLGRLAPMAKPPVIVKKYANRRLYDGEESRYVTLDELAAKVKRGTDVRVFDAVTGEDLTQATFAQIILESRGGEPAPAVRLRIRERLLEVRAERVRPGTDDKRLTSWNGLMISALAEAGAVLGREDYLAAARAAANFLITQMRDENGRLLRSFNKGEAKLRAYLEDHAMLLEGLLALYEATFEPQWYLAAVAEADAILSGFGDSERGGFFSTASDGEQLVARRKEMEDSPLPSGGSSAALGLLRLSLLSGDARYSEAALGQLRLVRPYVVRHPQAFGHALQAIDLHVGPARELALVGEEIGPLLEVVRSELRPRLVVAGGDGSGDESVVPLLEGRTPVDGKTAAYLCQNFACAAPVTGAEALADALA